MIAVVRSVDDFEDELEEFQDAALQLVDKVRRCGMEHPLRWAPLRRMAAHVRV